MCFEEYIKWYTEECPVYRRLSEAAASRKWEMDFNRLERTQTAGCDKDGNETGQETCLHCCSLILVFLRMGPHKSFSNS